MLSGAIQQTQENTDRAWKMYPGKKYQSVVVTKAIVKKRSRLIPPRLPIPEYTWWCRVLNNAQLTKLVGQTNFGRKKDDIRI